MYREPWVKPKDGFFKFNVDGATRGKPGSVGIVVVVHDCRGEMVCFFSESVGCKESNGAELLRIRRALTLCLIRVWII